MSAQKKKTTRPTKAKCTKIVAELRENYPDIYKRIALPDQSPIPVKTLSKLRKEAKALSKGVTTVIPVQGKAFRVRVHLEWGDATNVDFWIEEYLPNIKGALKNEKLLVRILDEVTRNEDHQSIEEDVREDVYGSQEFKRFARRCEDFCRELERQEDECGFDYYQEIGRHLQ